MAEMTEKAVAKKDNFFKRIMDSEITKKVVQIGTTVLTLANSAFLIYTCIVASSEAPVEMPFDSDEVQKLEVKPGPDVGIAENQA